MRPKSFAIACLAATALAAPDAKRNLLRSPVNTSARRLVFDPQPIPQATADQWTSWCNVAGITLCDGYFYTGNCFTGFDIVSQPKVADSLHNTVLLGKRDFNDHVRSVRVPLGCTLHLFDERDHRGHRNDVIFDRPILCGGWNTGVSSVSLSGFDIHASPGQYVGSEDGCVGMFMPNPLPKWGPGMNAFNLNYHAAMWLATHNMRGEVFRAEHGKLPGGQCNHDGDCKNLRCVFGVCRHGYPGDPCEHDSDCISDFKSSWKKGVGICVQNTCRNGFVGDFCEENTDCLHGLVCKEDDAPDIAAGGVAGFAILGPATAGALGASIVVNPVAAAAFAAGIAISEAAIGIWSVFHVNQCKAP